MAKLSCICSNWVKLPSLPLHFHSPSSVSGIVIGEGQQQRGKALAVSAAKSGGFSLNSILKRCETCEGQGAIECPGCKGTGRNKKNGNIFERWKCYDCQGFGLKGCPSCGKGGLTPEQRGER